MRELNQSLFGYSGRDPNSMLFDLGNLFDVIYVASLLTGIGFCVYFGVEISGGWPWYTGTNKCQ
jgi:hypothetical protein